MTILTEQDISNGSNYKTMMRDNLEEIKKELYEDQKGMSGSSLP